MRKNRARRIEALAAVYNCGLFIALAIGFLALKRYFLLTGLGLVLYGVYGIVGTALKWKHIFCAHQLSAHKATTPDNIKWWTINKSDAYGLPAFWIILGVAMIIVDLFKLW